MGLAKIIKETRKGIAALPESKKKKAKDLGFDTETVLYHGTMQDVDAFEPGYEDGLIFLTPDPGFASYWAGKGKLQDRKGEISAYDRYKTQKEKLFEDMGRPEFGTPEYDELVNRITEIYRQENNAFKTVYPVVTRVQKTFVPEMHYGMLEELFGSERFNAPFSSDFPRYSDALKSGAYLLYETPEVINFLKSKGFDSVALREDTYSKKGREGPYSTIAVFEPEKIRSINAEFDPKEKNSPQILKAGGGAVGYDEIDIFGGA